MPTTKGDELYWNGYKVHVTETCDTPDPTPDSGGGDRPNIIVGVATTDATVPDTKMTDPIHAALAARDLLPAEHYLDSGYPSAALVLDSLRRWGVTLVTPLLADQSRQARAGAGYDRASFTIDFDSQQARCPQGQTSTWWNPVTQRGTDAIAIKFAADPVPSDSSAPARSHRRSGVSSPCRRERSTTPNKRHEPLRKPRTGRPVTPPAPASRAPSAKQSPSQECAAPATGVYPRPGSNTCSRPPRSPPSACTPTGTDTRWTGPEPAT